MQPVNSQHVVKKRRRRRRPGEEEIPTLRTTCEGCTNAKVKCNGETPCVRCKNKNIQCEYTLKKRCGPKKRKGVEGARLACISDSEGLLASCVSLGSVGLTDHLRSVATALTKDEVECVGVFMQNVNSFLPLTTVDAVKEVATPKLTPDGVDVRAVGNYEEGNQLRHAMKALLHGAIALGAEFLEQEELSLEHASIAGQEIKECFDAAVPELVSAYLVLALYWNHQMDSSKITQYIRLARTSSGIISNPPAGLVASLTFISVVLYDAKVLATIECRVERPGPAVKPGSPLFKSPAAYQERILKILSFVLFTIHNRSKTRDQAIPTTDWDPPTLAALVDEAKVLFDKGTLAGPNDMTYCIVVVLQAYFLILSGDKRQAVMITEKVADLVVDNPFVLHLPIVWSMVGCVRALLVSANRAIAIERLQLAMEPLASHLSFSSEGSLVEQELMSVFGGQPRPRRGGGPSTVPAPENADMFCLKPQTSSLNVTAQDYSLRSRSPIDLRNLEPSPAPRRRTLPISSSRYPPSGGGSAGGRAVGTLSQSLISATSVLASSPPHSRAGVLSRSQALRARSSTSTSNPFEPAGTSMLQLGMSFTENRNFSVSSMPGVVPASQPADLTLPAITINSNSVSSATATAITPLGVGEEDRGNGDSQQLNEEVAGKLAKQEMQASFKADALLPLDLDSDRSDLLAKQGTGLSFKSLRELSFKGLSFKSDTSLAIESGADRRELMVKQQVQQSFRADAPVSLEQVESNMARLGVSAGDDGETAIVDRIVTSIDLDTAAELIAAKTSSFS